MKKVIAKLPTRRGQFRIVAFSGVEKGKDHVALVKGDIYGKEDVPVRIHSSCLTGDIFGSLRCDCRDQLEMAMDYIARRPYGVIVYLDQEGRGIGLYNKIRAYALQENGYDTAEANRKLGFKYDTRNFTPAAKILKALGVKSVQLMTNNPRKIGCIEKMGIGISGRIPIHPKSNKYNKKYLKTKMTKLGHISD
jgi:GTP cyclohydrolase II